VELALAGAAHITLVNRTPGRGQELAGLLNHKTPVKADFVPWQGAYTLAGDTDVLVNATSIGLYPNVNDRPDLDYDTIRPGMRRATSSPIRRARPS
jgi:shikimate dehydrogenase